MLSAPPFVPVVVVSMAAQVWWWFPWPFSWSCYPCSGEVRGGWWSVVVSFLQLSDQSCVDFPIWVGFSVDLGGGVLGVRGGSDAGSVLAAGLSMFMDESRPQETEWCGGEVFFVGWLYGGDARAGGG
jgi:hypothetical protein